jgi:hypothetical protein
MDNYYMEENERKAAERSQVPGSPPPPPPSLDMQTILEMIKAHDKFLRAPEVTCIGIGCRRFIYPDSDSDHNSPDSDPDYDSDGTKLVETQRVSASTSPIPGQAEPVPNVAERSSVPVPVQPPSPLKHGEESGAEETSGSRKTLMSKFYDSYTTDLKPVVEDSFPSRKTDKVCNLFTMHTDFCIPMLFKSIVYMFICIFTFPGRWQKTSNQRNPCQGHGRREEK